MSTNTQTHTDLVTSSLLELLIAAKNNLVKQILVKKKSVSNFLVENEFL